MAGATKGKEETKVNFVEHLLSCASVELNLTTG
jgi:hypothetical protein